MADAARRWLDDLEPAQRARAWFPFETDDRRNWDYRPGPRVGLSLGEMTPSQRSRAHVLVGTGLSDRSVAEVREIIALEPVLGEIERRAGVRDWTRRDPGLYWFAVFGDAGSHSPWSWRIGGHHVTIHVTVVGDRLATTPLFLGANPATVPHGIALGRRTLAAEEELARDLLGRLSPSQRSIAVVDPVAPPDILTDNDRMVGPHAGPIGVRYADLDVDQRTSLERLVQSLPRACATRRRAGWLGPDRIGRAGSPDLCMGRSGGARSGPLLRGSGTAASHRIRQHPGRREPHPLGVARSHQRLGRGPAGGALRRQPLGPTRMTRLVPGSTRSGSEMAAV